MSPAEQNEARVPVEVGEPSEESPSARSPRFTFKQRLILALVKAVGVTLITLIGRTLRYEYSYEEGASDYHPRKIYSFWHRCIFPAAWRFRNLKIAVMTSRSFDGEYIARIIEHFGFQAVRGSSSRGAVGALIGMNRVLQEGEAVAFTIDGPRGPIYVAKPGPVLLAKKSQCPMVAFYLASERSWIFKTWDRMVIPKPFSRVVVRFAPDITVPPDADDATMQAKHAELQAALERVRDFAEAAVGGEA